MFISQEAGDFSRASLSFFSSYTHHDHHHQIPTKVTTLLGKIKKTNKTYLLILFLS